jgi:hypothetical protein
LTDSDYLKGSGRAKVIDNSTEVDLDSSSFGEIEIPMVSFPSLNRQSELLSGDEIAHICRVGLVARSPEQEPIGDLGAYQVYWRR